MAVTITISEQLSKRLQAHAQTFQLPLDALVEQLLADALPVDETNGFEATDEPAPADQPAGELDDPDAELARIVAQIKATPPNPDAIERATKSAQEVMAELLANPPSDDLLTFEEFWPLWQAFEQELKEMDKADAIDEGSI
jgi:predicted transcriptional regulator